jgi:hypothetical protein
MATAIEIGGVSIRGDKDGRFSLNDLHRAAVEGGVTKDIRPNEWMALDQTKDLAGILITENQGSSPIKTSAGRYGGTFVSKELVYAYAMWISPIFHLRVIRAYDALANGAIAEATRLAQRQVARQAARLEAPALTDAVRHIRTAQGKEVEHYHFSNEFDLINRVALGMSAKQFRLAHGLGPEDSIRDQLTTLQIKCIEHLQRHNAALIEEGMTFEERKASLNRVFLFRHSAALMSEFQRLEA